MFKKIMSLALALVMICSVAVVAATAAQVEIAGSNADTPADVSADAPADTSAGQTITFDPSATGWNNYKYISFHIWNYDSGEGFFAYGSKQERGKDNGDGTYSYDLAAKGVTLDSNALYAVIFYNENKSQTYNLLMGTSCIGDTAYCDGTEYENPVDSSKTALAAFWRGQDASQYGPEKCITSIGNVVGTCIPSTVSSYSLFVKFLKDNLENARTYSGKDDQTLLDDTAAALGNLKAGDVTKAIAEAGVTTTWSEEKSTLEKGEDPNANVTPGGGSTGGDSNNNDSNNNNGGGGSAGGSSNKKTGSASNTKTGQDMTMLYVMLGVMVLAAGVIVVVRKKERA